MACPPVGQPGARAPKPLRAALSILCIPAPNKDRSPSMDKATSRSTVVGIGLCRAWNLARGTVSSRITEWKAWLMNRCKCLRASIGAMPPASVWAALTTCTKPSRKGIGLESRWTPPRQIKRRRRRFNFIFPTLRRGLFGGTISPSNRSPRPRRGPSSSRRSTFARRARRTPR